MSAEERAASLGVAIPEPPTPKGSYRPARRIGDLVFTSGMSAVRDGERRYVGKLGREVSIEDGYASARHAVVNCLAAVRSLVGSLDAVTDVVRVTGYVNSAPGFDRQPAVVDGASDLLGELFGERGQHARSAIGVSDLPFGISVEVELVVAVHPEGEVGP